MSTSEPQSPQSPHSPHPPELPNGLPSGDSIDRMLEHSQRQSEIRLGQIPHLEHEQKHEQEQNHYTHISQNIQTQETLQDQITRSLLRLEEHRLAIHQHTTNLEQELHYHHQQDQDDLDEARRRRFLRALRTRRAQRRTLFPKPPAKKTSNIHPTFKNTIAYFSHRLHPLVSVSTGLTHPDFPKTILSLHLLTEAQLNSLALHYHQVYPPMPETYQYPLPITPWMVANGYLRDMGGGVAMKRRRFGRFIGLRGCESPVGNAEGGGDRKEWMG
ncbi:hypothetical protein BDW59DRAFT_157797 [Aspergillus cavernicola]|uniref:Uncharacterized protein n=1 Tax=Aspergillus cavernicola TaxID=176166 RepID=A0ABR4IVR6_9EURO